MPTLDIPVSEEVQKMFDFPPCSEIKLPQPKPVKIQLPSGPSLSSFTDIGKNIPTDCSLTINLLIQLAPLLASMDCLIKILKLLKPLIDVIKGLPFPPLKALKEFAEAAVALVPCFAIPAGIPFFVRDILCVILKLLKCLVEALTTVKNALSGLSLQIASAEALGNSELLASLKCAQENAQAAAQNHLSAIEPIGAIFELIGPMLEVAGQPALALPAIGSETDVAALDGVITALNGLVTSIETITDALGGCGS